MQNYLSLKKQRIPMSGVVTYHFLAFPLGLIYFILAIVGLSVGLGTLVIWIGIPLLFVTAAFLHGIAAFERGLVASLLKTELPHVENEPLQGSFMRRFGRMITDPLTWSSLFYTIIKLPMGIISFVLLVTLPVVSFVLTALPLAYLLNLWIDIILHANGVESHSMLVPYFIEIHYTFEPDMFLRCFLLVPIGLLLWVVTGLVLRAFANVQKELVASLLCRHQKQGEYYQKSQASAMYML